MNEPVSSHESTPACPPPAHPEAADAIAARLDRLESIMERLVSEFATAQQQLRRTVDMKTARTGEMSSRIAQRLARLEAAVELLARSETPEEAESP